MMAGAFRSGAKCVRVDRLKANDDESKIKFTSVWDSPKFSNDIASSVLYKGHVYGFDLRDAQSRVNRPSRGEYRCLEFETGKILWSTDTVGHANTIVADGKLILFNDRGEVILARARSDQYEELARTTVFHDEICWSPAALHRGRLYLRTHTQAVCLYLGNQPLEATQPLKTVASIPRVRAFDPTPFLGGERQFPATVPEWSELFHWYLWSLFGLGIALVVSLLVHPLLHLGRFLLRRTQATCQRALTVRLRDDVASQSVFWLMTIIVGTFGSRILNRWQEDYVFLWPVILWSALQLTVLATTWAERQATARSRARWVSRLSGLAFLATCGLYFHLCRRLGLSIEWGFLSGLLPAFPFAAIAARGFLIQGRFRSLIVAVSVIASFTGYYFSAAMFLKWYLPVGS